MKEHRFGNKSNERLLTCQRDLIKIMMLAISRSNIDFSIVEGHRPVSVQLEYYNANPPLTRVKFGKHNLDPSNAVDICIWHPNRATRMKIAYDPKHLCYVAGIIQACAVELHAKGEVEHLIRWGGNWDKDDVIIYDQSFQDLVHFEIYKP